MVEIVSGSQQRRSMNRNCWTNSVPYGYGGRIAETSVLPVRIIMSPTCSSRFLVGRNTRSAAALTTTEFPPQGELPTFSRNTYARGSLCHADRVRQREPSWGKRRALPGAQPCFPQRNLRAKADNGGMFGAL